MNQININPAPAISMRITKKNSEISWFSEDDIRNTNHPDNKNKKLKKDFKKNK